LCSEERNCTYVNSGKINDVNCLALVGDSQHFTRCFPPKNLQGQRKHTCSGTEEYYDLKNIFAKNLADNLAFFVQNTAGFCKIWIRTLVFKINAIFRRKLAKIGKT
jgi:hypothetical protein